MNNHTNIILLSVPHRHDLSEWSCVNSEVVAFNRKFFTRHSLHKNNLGNERIALKIANSVTILQKQTEDPISLCWKMNLMTV